MIEYRVRVDCWWHTTYWKKGQSVFLDSKENPPEYFEKIREINPKKKPINNGKK